jgi:hypothetical protein
MGVVVLGLVDLGDRVVQVVAEVMHFLLPEVVVHVVKVIQEVDLHHQQVVVAVEQVLRLDLHPEDLMEDQEEVEEMYHLYIQE